MRKVIIFAMAAVLTLSSQFCANTYATYAMGGGQAYIFPGGSGAGQSTIAESYSIVWPVDDYQLDNGYPAVADTSVSTASGEASSWARVPYYLAANAAIFAEAEAYGMDKTRAWAGAKETGIIATITDTMTFELDYWYELDLPQDSDGYVQFYVGFWEGSPEGADLLLTAKEGWDLVNLGTDPDPYYVLAKTFTAGADSLEVTTWPVPYVEGREYSYYTFVDADADVIPEPATFLLLGLGGLFIHRRQ